MPRRLLDMLSFVLPAAALASAAGCIVIGPSDGTSTTGGTGGFASSTSSGSGVATFASLCAAYYVDVNSGGACGSCASAQFGSCIPLQSSGGCDSSALTQCEQSCESPDVWAKCACIEACLGGVGCVDPTQQYYACLTSPCVGTCPSPTGSSSSSTTTSSSGGGTCNLGEIYQPIVGGPCPSNHACLDPPYSCVTPQGVMEMRKCCCDAAGTLCTGCKLTETCSGPYNGSPVSCCPQ